MAKNQNRQMIQNSESDKMIPPQEQEQGELNAQSGEEGKTAQPGTEDTKTSDVVAKKGHKAKVNMHLPTGQVLTEGEHIELTKESHAHLAKHFPGDAIKHILE